MPTGSIRIGKIFGVVIELNFTWFVIFGLVTLSLATGYFPTEYPELKQAPVVNLFLGVITSILFFGSVLFHELCHSLVARLNNVPIKKITLFIFGGVAQMEKEPENPAAEFKMAVAGPASSFLLSFLFWIGLLTTQSLRFPVIFTAPLLYLSWINALLAIFNLVPGFPLDGGRVLRAILWHWLNNLTRATRIASLAGQGVAYFLIFIGFIGVLGQMWGLAWFILIGWFLQHAAQASYQHQLFESALSQVKVKDIMTKEVQIVEPEITLEQLVNDYFLKYKYGRFPVIENGRLLGIVTLHDIREIPRDQWDVTTTREAVVHLEEKLLIGPEEEAVTALKKMAQLEVGHLLVVEDGQLVGLVTRSDIIHLIKVKTELGV